MGNICGKTDPEPFSQPGRVLGTAPPANYGTASVPKNVEGPKKLGGPPRTLGGNAATANSSPSGPDDPRRKAAEAAEARAKAAAKGGKLKSQLDAQKKQNRVDTLKDASNQELRTRDADEAAKARQWD